jgi:hypothetical protein
MTTTTHNYRELKPPELFKFEQPGQQIEGRLLAMNRVAPDKDRPNALVLEYLFRLEDGKLVKTLATADLLQKIDRSCIGKFMLIEFLGHDENVSKHGNAMKRFRVCVDDGMPAVTTEISDEDIPF